jgi:hypothetical protein
VDLLNEEEQFIGMLRLPTDKPHGTDYELIELSAGCVQRHAGEHTCFDEWDRPGFWRYWNSSNYEFFNVMAISWVDGIAFREAVGRVEKSSWEALIKDNIDIILG